MRTFLQDLQYGARMVRQQPGYSAIVVLTLALAIGVDVVSLALAIGGNSLIQTLEDALARSSFQQRISALLLGIFAAVALMLAAIGIYGVMSYSVSARTQEMGVRFALGAQRLEVMWLVMRHVLALAAIGLAIGIALLVIAGRAVETLLFGVRPADPVTIAVVALGLAAVALLAAWAPAARASRVDPMEALRYE
jgi:putative ABC transport system permease protein